MNCPSTQIACDNPGCRRGGCQGRLPQLPLFQILELKPVETTPIIPPQPRNAPGVEPLPA